MGKSEKLGALFIAAIISMGAVLVALYKGTPPEWSLNMRPALAINNAKDIGLRAAKSSGKFRGAHTFTRQEANLPHHFIRQFAGSVFLAWVCHAPFLSRILHVVNLGTEKQVVRSHAWWVVAAMADFHSSRYRAIGQRIREAVRSIRSWGWVMDAEPAITLVQRRSPKPTGIGFPHLRPETLLGRDYRTVVALVPALVLYNLHVIASTIGDSRAGDVLASPGLLMPNYSTFGGV
jgi:hypothetical protein